MGNLLNKMKNDKYRKVRGGQARMIDVFCVKCDAKVIEYQKDGKGNLHRCYLNRIFSQKNYEELQYVIKDVKQMPNLECMKCHEVIGTPMIHTDGRFAFRLRYGHFYKKLSKNQKE